MYLLPKMADELRKCRGYTKRSMNLIASTNVESCTIEKLHIIQKKLGELFTKYEDLNIKLLSLCEEDDEDVEGYQLQYYDTLGKIEAKINSLCGLDLTSRIPPVPEQKTYSAPSTSSSSTRIKLPNININNFNGKYGEYVPFINLFTSVIHKDDSLDNIQKLYYLRTYREEPFDLVKNLPLTNESYPQALKLLDDRYNNRYKIVSEHIGSLLDINALQKPTPSSIRDFVSRIKQSLAALRNLNTKVGAWDAILICVLTRKLDAYTARAFQLERDAATEPSVEEFLQFLEKRALAMENAEPTPPMMPMAVRSGRLCNIATVEGKTLQCFYCNNSDHKLFTCKKNKLITPAERIKFVNDNKLCVICLNRHTKKIRFYFKCDQCKERHNYLLHQDKSPAPVTLMSGKLCTNVLLPTVRIKLYGANKQEVHVKAILDSASQASLVTTKLVEVLGLTPKPNSTSIIGVTNNPNNVQYSIPLEIFSLTSPYKTTINCHVLEKITCKLPQFKIDPSTFNIPPGIQLADDDFNIPSEITCSSRFSCQRRRSRYGHKGRSRPRSRSCRLQHRSMSTTSTRSHILSTQGLGM